jgi:tRNA nucleotidyltransferase (CCA-adding enzyme)
MRTVKETEALAVLRELRRAGHAAYFVGGYVRDVLLSRPVKDIDIATAATPQEVLALFPRAIPTGLQHGTVTVVRNGHAFEVTTFRKESGYESYRRPERVEFIDDLEEDLRRRDFTINAMAMDDEGGVIDPFGGRDDLEAGLLRAVGPAAERFGEDALRMLRCIRFAAEYGLRIEESTWQALIACRPLMRHIAMERVRAELERIICGSDPYRGLSLFAESGLADHLKADIGGNARWDRAVRRQELAGIGRLGDCDVRWALLMVALDADAGEASGLLRRLTCSGKLIREVVGVLRFHLDALRADSADAWKIAVLRHGRAAAEKWLAMADVWPDEAEEAAAGAQRVRAMAERARGWLRGMPAASLGELPVRGQDIAELGAAGAEIGAALEHLLFLVGLGKLPNDRRLLLEEAERWLKERKADD